MFKNTKRSIAAVQKIRARKAQHKAKMKQIKTNEDWMLNVIDNAFANMK